MKSSFVTFKKVCKFHRIPSEDWRLNGQYNYIEFKNGSRIDLLDLAYQPRDPLWERFGSLEYTGGWIEEAGEVSFGAFDTLKSRIGRHLNREMGIPSKIFITTNPKKNWLYKLVYKPFREKTLPKEYAFIQSLYMDNPYTAEAYGKELAQIKDKATKQRLMYGNWEYDDDPNTLIEYDAIIDLFTNSVPEDTEKYLTCDVARYGRDKTVIMLWEGWKVYKIIEIAKSGLDKVEDKIRDIAKEEFIPYSHIIVDEDGVGGGVVDNLKGIKGFINNSSALPNPLTKEKENYKNLKSQCYYMLADKINARGIRIETDSEQVKIWLEEELELVKAKDIEKDAPLQIIPKDEVIELLGRSPDYSDALMMRMWFNLVKTIQNPQPTQFTPDYSKSNYKKR